MKPLVRIALLGLLIGLLLIPSSALSEELGVRQARPDEIGIKARCPVMDYNFEVKAGTAVIDYKDKSFYFCCEGCPQEFKQNPGKYTVQ